MQASFLEEINLFVSSRTVETCVPFKPSAMIIVIDMTLIFFIVIDMTLTFFIVIKIGFIFFIVIKLGSGIQ